MNATLFGGLMVVMYDPSEGIPKQMDFKSAPFIVDNNEGSFKISQTLIYKNFIFNSQTGVAQYKYFKPIGPIVVAVDSAIEKTFTNAVLQQMRETTKYFLSFSFQMTSKISMTTDVLTSVFSLFPVKQRSAKKSSRSLF